MEYKNLKIIFNISIFIVTYGIIFSLSCKRNSTGNKTPTSKNNASSERIGGQGEGIGGYLAQPEKVSIVQSGTQLVVSAPSGAVRAYVGQRIEDISLGLWTIIGMGHGPKYVEVENIGCYLAQTDGSFRIVASALLDRHDILVTVGKPCKSKEISLENDLHGNQTHTSLYLKYCPGIYTSDVEMSCSFTHNGVNYGGSVSLPESDEEFRKHILEHPEIYEGSDLERDLKKEGYLE